jgi:hypothetical protein
MGNAMLLVGCVLCLASLAFADFTIPSDQPICRLYSMIQLFAAIGGIIASSYAGFLLATTHDLNERGNAKMLLGGVFIGLIIVWLAPQVVKYLVGTADICGW